MNDGKNRRQKHRSPLVRVSALALSTALCPPAFAQNINAACPQNFDAGEHIACGNGSIRINPDSSTVPAGCVITLSVPQAARCTVSVTGGVPTRSVVVSFAATSIFINAGPEQATVDSFKMQETGQPTTASKFTFTPAEMTTPVTLDIGGTLRFSDRQPTGNYSGSLTLNANFN